MNILAKELVRIAKEVEAVRWMSDEDIHHQRENWWLSYIEGRKQKDYMGTDEIDISATIQFPNADDEGDFDSSRVLWRTYDISNDELGLERNDVWMPNDLGKEVAKVLKAFGRMMASEGLENYEKEFRSSSAFNSWNRVVMRFEKRGGKHIEKVPVEMAFEILNGVNDSTYGRVVNLLWNAAEKYGSEVDGLGGGVVLDELGGGKVKVRFPNAESVESWEPKEMAVDLLKTSGLGKWLRPAYGIVDDKRQMKLKL